MYLDSHQHFWKYDPVNYAWIDKSMASIRRDFLPADLRPILEKNGFSGCIAVQADQTENETNFLLDLADEYNFIEGVVGWVDLCATNIEDRLQLFANHPKLCGIRHIVQGEPDHNFMLRPAFLNGLRTLKAFDLKYDILVFPHQLGAVLELTRMLPDQPFVIDHIAKPYIKDCFFDGWATMMKEIATYPNVFCKVSGMITEADWADWTPSDFTPYLDVVFSSFGTERTMFGSDWPVCLVAGSYERMLGLVQRYVAQFTAQEQDAFFGGNGRIFYGL